MAEVDAISETTWTVDGKTYLLSIIEPGSGITAQALDVVSNIKRRGGDPNYKALEPILESEVQFALRDSGKFIRTRFATRQLGDIVLLFKRDSDIVFKGYVSPGFQRYRAYQDNPSYALSAYDGIQGLDGYTYAESGDKTVREQIWAIANKIGLGLGLDIFFEWKHNNADASLDPPDKLRMRLEGLYKQEGTYLDALKLYCEAYNAQFFQQGGLWRFMQRSERGAAMMRYPTSELGVAGAAESVDYITLLTNDDLHREPTDVISHPATARIVSRQKIQEFGLRNGDFSQGRAYWDGTSTEDPNGRLLDNAAEYLEQEVGSTFRQMPAPIVNRDRVNLTYRFFAAIDGAATGSGDIEFGRFKFIDLDGNERWLDVTGGWNASETTLKHNFADLSLVAGTTQECTGSFTSGDLPFTPMAGTLRLIFEQIIAGNPWITSIVHAEYDVKHIKPDEDEDLPRPTERVFTLESDEPGENLEQDFFFGDADSKHIAPGVLEYYNGVLWKKTQDWDGAGLTFHKLRATNRHDQTKSRQDGYEFAHKFGAEIDLHSALGYDGDKNGYAEIYVPTFIESIYRRSGKVQTRSSALRLLGAQKFAAVPKTIYFANSANQIRFATIVRGSYPWASSPLVTITRTSILDMKIDEADEAIITIEAQTGDKNRYIRLRDFSGGAGSDIVTLVPANPSFAPGPRIDIDRVNNLIYVVTTDANLNDRVVVYDYSGTVVATAPLVRDTTLIGAAALSEDGSYLIYQTLGGGTGRMQKYDVATNINSDIETYAASVALMANAFLDDEYGYFFGEDAGDDKIVQWPSPGGGSFSDVYTTAGTVENGLAGDRVNRELYAGTSNSKIVRVGYDGLGAVDVIDESLGGFNIKHIDLGV